MSMSCSTAATGLLLAALACSVFSQAGARELAQASTTAFPLLQRANLTALGSTLSSSLNSAITDPVAALFSRALSQASTGPASDLVSSASANFQQLVNQQATYYKNLQANLEANNSTYAKQAVCDLGTTYQSLPALAGSSSSSLTALLSNTNYATAFNKECQGVGAPGKSPLVSAVEGLASNATLSKQVENLVSKTDKAATTTASTVPAYLQGTTVGKLLASLGTSTPSTATSGVASALYSNLLANLGASPAASAGSTLGSGQLATSLLNAVKGATPPSSVATPVLSQVESYVQGLSAGK